MNTRRLRGEIVSVFNTQSAFASEIGWTKNKVTRMLSGKYKPNTDEVALIASTLHFNEAKFCEIFFAN